MRGTLALGISSVTIIRFCNVDLAPMSQMNVSVAEQ